MRNFKEQLIDIKAFVFDVDGVFTDSTITTLQNGDVLRSFNVKDGFAVVKAISEGYHVGIISGGGGELLHLRMSELGVEHIYLRSKDKLGDLHSFLDTVGVTAAEAIFVGDDLPDIAPMRACGLSVAPHDAVSEVRQVARYVSAFEGGRGVVRDVIEQVLRARGNWYAIEDEAAIKPY